MKYSTSNVQIGFTLIELMVTIILGILISAAVIQIFYSSYLSSNIQKSGSEVVETGTFGFDYFVKQVRKANYGAIAGDKGSYYMNAETPQGGIVLTAPTNLNTFGNTISVTDTSGNKVDVVVGNNLRGVTTNNGSLIDSSYLTSSKSTLSTSNVTSGGSKLASDQLTIQYKVPDEGLYNCEGAAITKGDYIVERYFVRADGLACKAASYTYSDTAAKLKNGVKLVGKLDGNGQLIIPNVDYFRVTFDVSSSDDFATKPSNLNLQNIAIPSDPYTTLKNKRIVNIQIGMIIRSNVPVTASNDPTFSLLDKQNLKLVAPFNTDGKLRKVMQSTVIIRNARGTV